MASPAGRRATAWDGAGSPGLAGVARVPAPHVPALQMLAESERPRFFLWTPVAFGLGIAAYFALPFEPDWRAAAVMFAVAFVVFAFARRAPILSVAATALLLVAAGFADAKWRVETVRAPVLAKPVNNVELTGTVVRTEARPPRGERLTILVETIAGLPADKTPQLVRVRTLSQSAPVPAGERVRLKASLAPPSKPALPGGFDYARAAYFERIGGVGYSYAPPAILPRAANPAWYARWLVGIENLRAAIGGRVRAVLPGENGAIATALITGARGGISEATNTSYKNSGLYHILSISGLHMVIMAGAVFYMTRLVLAAIPAVALRYPIKKWAAAMGIVGALAYLAISGGAFATVRSALMIVVMFSAVLLDRPALALRNVAVSALLIMMVYPESLFDAGFQMSFAAVTGLIATYEEVRRRAKRTNVPHPVIRLMMFFGGIVTSTLIASAAVAPFAAYHFHQSQQYAVLANLLAIPVCNLIVMPAALATLLLMPLGLEALALWPMGFGIDLMTWCAQAVSALPGAVGHLPAIPTLAFVLIVVGGLWLALWQTPLRLAGIGMAIAGLAISPLLARPDIYVARNGALVAVRGSDGLLSAVPARQARFELERWLEYDGDARAAAEVEKAQGFACDGAGCVAEVKGLVVSVARHPAAIAEDCATARILVLDVPRPKGCDGPDAVIDTFDVWREGTHALYIDNRDGSAEPRILIDTVAAHRGLRPWAEAPPQRRSATVSSGRDGGSGGTRATENAAAGTASPPDAATGAAEPPAPDNPPAAPVLPPAIPPRPEIEDDQGEAEDDSSLSDQ